MNTPYETPNPGRGYGLFRESFLSNLARLIQKGCPPLSKTLRITRLNRAKPFQARLDLLHGVLCWLLHINSLI